MLSQQQRNDLQDICRAGHTMWWGYLHQNGTTQLKRWFGDHQDYTTDCDNNPFTVIVVTPFEADSEFGARRILQASIDAIRDPIKT